MQFKFLAALLLACMTAVVSAAPIPVEIPPLDVESRANQSREVVAEAAREIVAEAARDASPEPVCGKYMCM